MLIRTITLTCALMEVTISERNLVHRHSEMKKNT